MSIDDMLQGATEKGIHNYILLFEDNIEKDNISYPQKRKGLEN